MEAMMDLDLLLDTLTWLCIIPGAVFMIIGGIGLIRLPDVYARMHGLGIIDTLGAELILIGLMFQSGLSLVTVKLGLILAFIFVTSPTTTHALARACLNGGVTPKVDDDKSVVIRGGGSSKT